MRVRRDGHRTRLVFLQIPDGGERTYEGAGVYGFLRDGWWFVLDDFPIEVLQSLHDPGLVVVPTQYARINEFLV